MPLTPYQKFEQICVLILTGLIAAIVVFALWYLALDVVLGIYPTLSIPPSM